MIGHFNAGELASYRAGVVSDGRAARITAHLSSCSQCANVHSGLADVSQILASIPAPAMPETLTQRLHAAIAGEAAQRAVNTAPQVSGYADLGVARDLSPMLIPGRPDPPERARRRPPRLRSRIWGSPLLLRGLAAAGVLVLLVGGGVLLANQRGVGRSTSGAAPARGVKARPSPAAVGSVAAIRLRYRHGGQFVFTNAVTSDVNYTKADLPSGIRREVANTTQVGGPSAKAAPSAVQPRQQHLLNHTTVGQLESCLSRVATGGPVLLVELARYLGQPATIIVLRAVNDAFDVIVVGEACGPTGQDIITRLIVPTK